MELNSVVKERAEILTTLTVLTQVLDSLTRADQKEHIKVVANTITDLTKRIQIKKA